MTNSAEQIKEAPAPKPLLSDAEADNLAQELFDAAECDRYTDTADDLVRVVMKIVTLFTETEKFADRECNATFFECALYSRTSDFSFKMQEFREKAAA